MNIPSRKVFMTSGVFRFVDRLNGVRSELNTLDGDIKAECARFSEDIKYFAEFSTGPPLSHPGQYNNRVHVRYQGI